ncbi:unnamed protein product, partial [Didymodactylos carnosus]
IIPVAQSIDKLSSELNMYKANAKQQVKQDVSSFWNDNEAKIPILGRITRLLLSVSGTSVPSESAFSISGRLMQNRVSLKAD